MTMGTLIGTAAGRTAFVAPSPCRKRGHENSQGPSGFGSGVERHRNSTIVGLHILDYRVLGH